MYFDSIGWLLETPSYCFIQINKRDLTYITSLEATVNQGLKRNSKLRKDYKAGNLKKLPAYFYNSIKILFCSLQKYFIELNI